MKNNKAADNDWFRLESNKEGTRWFGKCWYIHEMLKYEFNIEFDVSFVNIDTMNMYIYNLLELGCKFIIVLFILN